MNGATKSSSYSASVFRYQLPALPSLSGPLTTGTSIPPPPPSPPRKDEHPLSRENINPLRQHPSTPDLLFSQPVPGSFPISPAASPLPISITPLPQTDYVTLKNTPSRDQPDFSPRSSKRPSSVRNLLSLKSLKRGYNNSTDTLASSILRPDSPSSGSTTPSSHPNLKRIRSGNFWGRRKSSLLTRFDSAGEGVVEGDVGKRSNTEHVEQLAGPERETSPPPRLPELKSLGIGRERGAVAHGGEDWFRDIQ